MIGLGYVGLPLAMRIANVPDQQLADALATGTTRFTADESDLAQADAIFIAVPSPWGRNRQPYLSVIEAAATKPFGFQAFYPGPGVGGHCIPLDPQFLAWRARELRLTTRFIDLAEGVNLHMPHYVVGRITDLLNVHGRSVSGSRILAVGVAYKANVGDDRESPALDVLHALQDKGAHMGILDPHVPAHRLAEHDVEVVAATDDLSGWDLAVVLTDHADIDDARIAGEVAAVFDTRGIYRRLGLLKPNVTLL